jgi:hypothetical protein
VDNLFENRQIRRLAKNALMSQKRFSEGSEPMTEEAIKEGLLCYGIEGLKGMYVRDTIDLDTFELLLDFKLGLGE